VTLKQYFTSFFGLFLKLVLCAVGINDIGVVKLGFKVPSKRRKILGAKKRLLFSFIVG